MEESIGEIEAQARAAGYRWILGVDEVGRGPLVGPVTTAAVIVDLYQLDWCEGLDDSKKLSELRRDELSSVVFATAPAATIEHVHAAEVDRLNVLGASLWGMETCARRLLSETKIPPGNVYVAVDGRQRLMHYEGEQHAIVRGDARSFAIAAASIIAKVARDRWMLDLHALHPQYGFDSNKGYPTAKHLAALQQYGVLDCHRRSFAPVRATLEGTLR